MLKEKVTLYDLPLKPADILLYLSGGLKKKLKKADLREIEKAFYQVVMEYKKRYDEKYLDKMII